MRTFRGEPLVAGAARGEVAWSARTVALSRINTSTGRYEDPDHEWHLKPLADRILVFPAVNGSTSGSYVLMNLALSGIAPSGIVVARPDAILIAGAMLAEIPVVRLGHAVLRNQLSAAAAADMDGSTGTVRFWRVQVVL